MEENPFVLEKHKYKRDINVLQHYVSDSAKYLSLMTGKSVEEARKFIASQLKPDGAFAFKDPEVHYLERNDDGDRSKKVTTLSKYLNEAIKDKDLIAPTLTTYRNPEVCKSLIVPFIDGNVKGRGVAKKEMFKARMAKNEALATIKNLEQTNRKLSNNSISGAHCSGGTPFYNKTAHSTLTSNCRSTSGYGNANNEKFLCGNRHYWSPDIVRNNIVSIVNNTNYDSFTKACDEFGIRMPTVEETIACYRYSTDLYWKGGLDHARLEALIKNLTPIQRGAFVYTGDIYHLMKYNEDVVRKLLDKLSAKITGTHSDPDKAINSANEDIRSLATQICSAEMKGKTVKDVTGTEAHHTLALTVDNISSTLNEYFNLIRGLWVTDIMPASVSVFPESIRRCAIVSDTDSTIFTVQDWVRWHRGVLTFDPPAIALAATMIFLAAQTITHILAKMSANFGIETERLHQIAMKNEFFFPVFCPTELTKHYYALISCQEGNVYGDFKSEIKGVHLKSSNAPKVIIKDAEKMMLFILNSVAEGKNISIVQILKWIADKERDVVESIKKGDYNYFRVGQIKSSNSYKNGEETSAYKQYLLWQEVFSDKYGSVPLPPYTAIKVGVDIDTPTKTKAWLDSIEDKEIVSKLENWLVKRESKSFGGMLLLPEQVISAKGIPDEIIKAIDIRGIVYDTTNIYYKILETLGLQMINRRRTTLCMDYY